MIALLLFCTIATNAQQKVIQLYKGAATGSENWTWNEKENSNNAFNTKIVYNVSHPTLSVFLPDPSIATGTAAIICPGGAFYILAINNEGYDVARRLAEKGVAAFVLKYRVGHSLTDEPVKELSLKMMSPRFAEDIASVIPLAIADGREAISYVRTHASEYGISPNKIGIIGFSAGGTVAASTAYNYTAENHPDFVAPVYAYMPSILQTDIPTDAPPIFIAAASDDNLGLAPHSVDLYNKWIAAKHPAELHMYVKGGHGFGMRKQNLPTDTWIDRFEDWLKVEGFLQPANTAKGKSKPTSQQIEESKKKPEEQIHADWADLKRFEGDNKNLKQPAANEKRVVFMGNSITEGWIKIDQAFFSGKPYIDRGISGQTTPQMLVRFRQDVIDLKPAAVVILAGINDIAQNTGPITLENTFGNIVSMAELAKANQIKVVLSSVLPAYDFPWRPGMQPAEKVVTLNAMIKEYANKNGIVYLDYYSAMVDQRKGLKASLSEDGVHPNFAGYKIMEPLAEKAIAEALKGK